MKKTWQNEILDGTKLSYKEMLHIILDDIGIDVVYEYLTQLLFKQLGSGKREKKNIKNNI